MGKKLINIDVIVPVYNCQNYIDRCIQSLLKQKNQNNLRIILVDDGSIDNSGKLIDRYADSHQNIVSIHKANGGLASSRNVGLKNVSGDYFTFIDPDDWVENDYIGKVIDELSYNRVDILMVPYIRKYNSISFDNQFLGDKSQLFDSQKIRSFLLKRFFGLTDEQLDRPLTIDNISTAWGKFYKTDMFSKVFFSNKKEVYAEDLDFNIKCFLNARSSEYFVGTRYIYFKENKSSIVHTYDPQMLAEYKNLYQKMYKIIDENDLGVGYRKALSNRIILNELAILRNISLSNKSFLRKIENIRNVFDDKLYDENYRQFELNKLPIKYRLFYGTAKYKIPVLMLMLLNLGEKFKTIVKQ